MVTWLFKSARGLLYSAAQKARHAEIAFRDASRAMDGTWHAIRHLHEKVPKGAPKQVPRNIYKTMRRIERHAKILRRHTLDLKRHMEMIERHTKKE